MASNKKIIQFLNIVFTELEPKFIEEIKANKTVFDSYQRFKNVGDLIFQANILESYLNRIVLGSELIYSFIDKLLETPRAEFYKKLEACFNDYFLDCEKKIEDTQKLLIQIEKFRTNTTLVENENDLLFKHFEGLADILTKAKSNLETFMTNGKEHTKTFFRIQTNLGSELSSKLIPYFKMFLLQISENRGKANIENQQQQQQ